VSHADYGGTLTCVNIYHDKQRKMLTLCQRLTFGILMLQRNMLIVFGLFCSNEIGGVAMTKVLLVVVGPASWL